MCLSVVGTCLSFLGSDLDGLGLALSYSPNGLSGNYLPNKPVTFRCKYFGTQQEHHSKV